MNNASWKGWYVLYVRSRHEKKVKNLLIENGMKPFLPIVKTVRNWSDRKKTVEIPLFPSYIFVNISSKKEFEKALSIDGACSYIRFGKEYAKATNEEITKIKMILNAGEVKDIQTSYRKPIKGDCHRIEHGPLSGLFCEIIRTGNSNKIVVSIDSIQQNIIATVPAYFLSELPKAV